MAVILYVFDYFFVKTHKTKQISTNSLIHIIVFWIFDNLSIVRHTIRIGTLEGRTKSSFYTLW